MSQCGLCEAPLRCSLGSRPPDAGLQASKEVAVPSALKHPINAANLDQLIDELDNDLAAPGFAASSPGPR